MSQTDFYRSMLENIYEGIYFVDKERQITFWNKGAERISGFSANEVVGNYCYNNILNHIDDQGNQLCHAGCPLHSTIEDGLMRETKVYLHHKNGHRVPVSVRAIAIRENDEIVGAVEMFVDESEKHDVLKNLEEYKTLAMHDQLTGLPNRRYIDSWLDSKYKEYKTLGIPFGVLFMDIDRFKLFNDTYGHEVGDRVLRMVADTMSAATRSTDLIGRFGGEEFIGVIAGVDEQKLEKLAEKLRIFVEKSSLRSGENELKVTMSIGATMFSAEDVVDSALKRADGLLYKSKETGRNRVTLG